MVIVLDFVLHMASIAYPLDRHTGCFCFLVTVMSAVMSLGGLTSPRHADLIPFEWIHTS